MKDKLFNFKLQPIFLSGDGELKSALNKIKYVMLLVLNRAKLASLCADLIFYDRTSPMHNICCAEVL